MNKIFYNINGQIYYVLFGGKGEKSLLCNVNEEQYVICQLLEENSWWQGSYFNKFEEAFKTWKGR